MPFYRYICNHCGHTEEKLSTYDKREEQTCSKCNEPTQYNPSYRFHATGLPNGFSSTRRPGGK